MNRLNGAFTVTSALVLLVTLERFSFTTSILLQPYSFIRLHELVQGPILLTLPGRLDLRAEGNQPRVQDAALLLALMLISLVLLAGVVKHWRQHPYLSYSAFAYSLATAGSLIVRLRA
jgi:hypothetical protein